MIAEIIRGKVYAGDGFGSRGKSVAIERKDGSQFSIRAESDIDCGM